MLRCHIELVPGGMEDKKHRQQLHDKVTQAYEIIGHLTASTPRICDGEIKRVLDYFADADAFNEDFLPWPQGEE